MRFQVEVPDDVFWRLAARAELFDQKVPDMTADLLIAAAVARVPSETDPVLRLWRAGFSDAQIAAYLNVTNVSVSSRRRRYGLPANRRHVSGVKETGGVALRRRERKEVA